MKKIALFIIFVLVFSIFSFSVGARSSFDLSSRIVVKEDIRTVKILPAYNELIEETSKTKQVEKKTTPASRRKSKVTGYATIYAPLSIITIDDAPEIVNKYTEPSIVSEGNLFNVMFLVEDDFGLESFKIKFDDGIVLTKQASEADCNSDETECIVIFEREDFQGDHLYKLYAYDVSDNVGFSFFSVEVVEPGLDAPNIVEKYTLPSVVGVGQEFSIVFEAEDDYELSYFKIKVDDLEETKYFSDADCENKKKCTVSFDSIQNEQGEKLYKLYAYDHLNNWGYSTLAVDIGCDDTDEDGVCDTAEEEDCVGENLNNLPENYICTSYVLEEGCHVEVFDDGTTVCSTGDTLQCFENNVHKQNFEQYCGLNGLCDGEIANLDSELYQECVSDEFCNEGSCELFCEDDDNDGVCNENDLCLGENNENMPSGNDCVSYSLDLETGCHVADFVEEGSIVEEVDCSYLNTDCRTYSNSADVCDGEGSLVYGACSEFENDDGSKICSEWKDYECPFGSLAGQNVFVQSVLQYCGSNSGYCNGEIEYQEDYSLQDECADTEKCVNNNPACQELTCNDIDNDGVCDYDDSCIGENQANIPPSTQCTYYSFNEINGCHDQSYHEQGYIVGYTQCGYLNSECKLFNDVPNVCNGQGNIIGGVCNDFEFVEQNTVIKVKDCDYLDSACADYADVDSACDGFGNLIIGTCNEVTYQAPGTSVSNKDCDFKDSICRDYTDVSNTCDGNGGTLFGVCDEFDNLQYGTFVSKKECDHLDVACTDYQDVNNICDGNGGIAYGTCDDFSHKEFGFPLDNKDCDYLDTSCRNYNDVNNYCDGQGSAVEAQCSDYVNALADTVCNNNAGVDYECLENVIYTQTLTQQCGLNGFCDGDVSENNDLSFFKSCNEFQVCLDNNPNCKDTDCTDSDEDGVCDYEDNCVGETPFNLPAEEECSYYDFNYNTGCHELQHNGIDKVVGYTSCDELDTTCRDYNDVANTCDGNGGVSSGACNNYIDKSLGFVTGTLNCDEFDTDCRNYESVNNICDGSGNEIIGECNSFSNQPEGFVVEENIDCDYLDTACKDYDDVSNVCDGSGVVLYGVCDESYSILEEGSIVGIISCDYLDTTCRDYSDSVQYCDAVGDIANGECEEYENDAGSSVCDVGLDIDYECKDGTNPGSDVFKQTISRKCGSNTGFCDGELILNADYSLQDSCSDSEVCVDDLGSCQACVDLDNDLVCDVEDACVGENLGNLPSDSDCVTHTFVDGCHVESFIEEGFVLETADCDYLDSECVDYIDVQNTCDGSGSIVIGSCEESYVYKSEGYQVGQVDCSDYNTACKTYSNSVDVCDGEGVVLYGACEEYVVDDGSTVCADAGLDYECKDGTDPGFDVFKQTKSQYCGLTGLCDGNVVFNSDWILQDDCSFEEICVNNNPTCQNYVCPDSDNDGVCDSEDLCNGETQENLPSDIDCITYSFDFENGCHVSSNRDEGYQVNKMDCDYLDDVCVNYNDVYNTCDGNGALVLNSCNDFSYASYGTFVGMKSCNLLDTVCRDYVAVENVCDGIGGIEEGTCDEYVNDEGSTVCDGNIGSVYSCENGNGLGSDVFDSTEKQYCGLTGFCDGEIVSNNDYSVFDECLEVENCVDDSSSCQSCVDSDTDGICDLVDACVGENIENLPVDTDCTTYAFVDGCHVESFFEEGHQVNLVDCDYLDGACVDYTDVYDTCNGNGGLISGTCSVFVNDEGSTVCDANIGSVYSCENGNGLGSNVFASTEKQFCGVDSGLCDGAVVSNNDYSVFDECSEVENCVDDLSSCQSCADSDNDLVCDLVDACVGENLGNLPVDTDCATYTFVDGCHVETLDDGSTSCSSGIDYECKDGTEPGDDVFEQTTTTYCGAGTGVCEGTVVNNADWTLQDTCDYDENCVNDNPLCQVTMFTFTSPVVGDYYYLEELPVQVEMHNGDVDSCTFNVVGTDVNGVMSKDPGQYITWSKVENVSDSGLDGNDYYVEVTCWQGEVSSTLQQGPIKIDTVDPDVEWLGIFANMYSQKEVYGDVLLEAELTEGSDDVDEMIFEIHEFGETFTITTIEYPDETQSYLWDSLNDLGSKTGFMRVIVYDEAGRVGWEDSGNVEVDNAGPETVTDLVAQPGNAEQKIRLTFTTPHETIGDSNSGKASHTWKMSTDSPITEQNWGQASDVACGAVPAQPGEVYDCQIVGQGIEPYDGTVYYFAMKSKDNLNRWSDISNPVSSVAPFFDITVSDYVCTNLYNGQPCTTSEYTNYFYDTLEIKVNVSNEGNYNEENLDVYLGKDGQVVDTQVISLEPGETKEIVFEYQETGEKGYNSYGVSSSHNPGGDSPGNNGGNTQGEIVLMRSVAQNMDFYWEYDNIGPSPNEPANTPIYVGAGIDNTMSSGNWLYKIPIELEIEDSDFTVLLTSNNWGEDCGTSSTCFYNAPHFPDNYHTWQIDGLDAGTYDFIVTAGAHEEGDQLAITREVVVS
jgi:hypothetical protein